MARTMREQEKLTPRRTILAMRTRVLTFCCHVSSMMLRVEGGLDLRDPWLVGRQSSFLPFPAFALPGMLVRVGSAFSMQYRVSSVLI